MYSRSVAVFLATVLFAPLASAHLDLSETTYDPLAFDLLGYPTATGSIASAPPAAASVFFPQQTPADATPGHLDFGMQAPFRFDAPNGLAVRLHVVADKPTLGASAGSASFVVRLLADRDVGVGQPRSVAFSPQAFATPGASQDIVVVIQTPGSVFEKGAILTLRVEPQMPAVADQALRIEVGEVAGTRADFLGARMPSIADLELAEPSGATLFLLANDTFRAPEPGAAIVTVSVKHNETTLTSKATAPVTYVVLRGDESVSEGRAFHEVRDKEARDAAAHLYRVGSQRVRVHPGLGVVVRVTLSASSVVDIACESSCPAGGWKTSLAAPHTDATPTNDATGSDPTNILIPPPRQTAGVPVSKDAPAEKDAPGAGFPAGLGMLAIAAFLRKTKQQRL